MEGTRRLAFHKILWLIDQGVRPLGMDLLPTIADLTGKAFPVGREFDGISLKGVLLKQAPVPHRNMFWGYEARGTAMRDGDWKFLTLKDRIISLHMHELGDDKYPYRLLFKLLSESGFEGYCNAEISDNQDPLRLMGYYRALFLSLQNAY